MIFFNSYYILLVSTYTFLRGYSYMSAQLKETYYGGCPHDCPDTCSMIFEVEDGKLTGVPW